MPKSSLVEVVRFGNSLDRGELDIFDEGKADMNDGGFGVLGRVKCWLPSLRRVVADAMGTT